MKGELLMYKENDLYCKSVYLMVEIINLLNQYNCTYKEAIKALQYANGAIVTQIEQTEAPSCLFYSEKVQPMKHIEDIESGKVFND